MGIWDVSSEERHQHHPPGFSRWLPICRAHLNFSSFSEKGIRRTKPPCFLQHVHCALHSYLPPLALPVVLVFQDHNPLPSEGSGNPYLGFVKREISLEMQKWLCWKCSVLCSCVRNEGDFRGWVLGGPFQIGVREHSGKVHLIKSGLKMLKSRKWQESIEWNRNFACFSTNCVVLNLLMHLQCLWCSKPRGGLLQGFLLLLFTRLKETLMGNLEHVPQGLHFPPQLCSHGCSHHPEHQNECSSFPPSRCSRCTSWWLRPTSLMQSQ